MDNKNKLKDLLKLKISDNLLNKLPKKEDKNDKT